MMSTTRPLGGTLKHHHWQALACLVADHRPEWEVHVILDKLRMCEDLQTYPDLARTALCVAMDPAAKSPASIHFAAARMTN